MCRVSTNIRKFEIDHIIPLASGGSNEVENLQPLCVDCHLTKTESERENGEYMEEKKISEMSYFNNNVFENVINTEAFKTWQFVERIKENIHLEQENSSFEFKKIDMNKCRRNILYYSKFMFPVYSVMDTVLPFSLRDKIKVGRYYVETENTLLSFSWMWQVFSFIDNTWLKRTNNHKKRYQI